MLEDFGRELGIELRASLVRKGERRQLWGNGVRSTPGQTVKTMVFPWVERSVVEVEAVGGTEREMRLLESTMKRSLRLAGRMRAQSKQLADRTTEVDLLFYVSEALGSILRRDEVVRGILERTREALDATQCSLWVTDSRAGVLRLAESVGGAPPVRAIPVDHPSSVSAKAFLSGRSISSRDHLGKTGLTLVATPVSFLPEGGDPRILGVLNATGRWPREMGTSQKRLTRAIASQLGAALETHRLIQEDMARQRASTEIRLAHDLQMKLIPPIPELSGIDAAAKVDPAESVGGDFYQVLQLSGGRVGVMIGDVSGHGFPAALIMALVISAAAIYAEQGANPADVLAFVDRAIGDELTSTETFVSICYCVLRTDSRRITYSNAGHPHAFVVSPAGDRRRLGATDLPMGIGTAPYTEATTEWDPNSDVLLLFTDGLSDKLATRRRSNGESLVLDTVGENHDRPSRMIVGRLFDLASEAIPSIPSDDRTAVVVRGPGHAAP